MKFGSRPTRHYPACVRAIERIALIGLTAVTFPAFAADPSPDRTQETSQAEFKRIETADDLAQAEVNQWLEANRRLKGAGGGAPDAQLEGRITERFKPVKRAYEEYLARHPADAHAHLVFGSFLNDRDDERGAQQEWEKALALDPNNAAVYNNLAGRYSESGPVDKAFRFYAKAIELGPEEPVYYHNFADSLYVLRTHAAKFYGISEQEVYAKSLAQYSNALRLAPTNFAFARDVAQTYYSLKPLPFESASGAWSNAMKIASEPADREEAMVHLARLKMLAGRFSEARLFLEGVTNQANLAAKKALLHNLEQREKSAANPGAEGPGKQP